MIIITEGIAGAAQLATQCILQCLNVTTFKQIKFKVNPSNYRVIASGHQWLPSIHSTVVPYTCTYSKLHSYIGNLQLFDCLIDGCSQAIYVHALTHSYCTFIQVTIVQPPTFLFKLLLFPLEKGQLRLATIITIYVAIATVLYFSIICQTIASQLLQMYQLGYVCSYRLSQSYMHYLLKRQRMHTSSH